MYRGKPIMDDDYLYCVVEAVFTPTLPDPSGRYSYKFVGDDWRWGVTVGRAPYGQWDRPGYGSGKANLGIQTCRSLLDPPDKDCPERPD
jgi:hypothetical protein